MGRLDVCRDAFGHVLECAAALVDYLKVSGPERVHNIDNLLLRESMDVIGTSQKSGSITAQT